MVGIVKDKLMNFNIELTVPITKRVNTSTDKGYTPYKYRSVNFMFY